MTGRRQRRCGRKHSTISSWLPRVAPNAPLEKWQTDLRNGPAVSTGAAASPVLVHADLAAEHVLCDPATHALTGIIDWSAIPRGLPGRCGCRVRRGNRAPRIRGCRDSRSCAQICEMPVQSTLTPQKAGMYDVLSRGRSCMAPVATAPDRPSPVQLLRPGSPR
ncbi:MAG: phosphotransferase [Longimicrobiales bacterium]